MDENLPTDEKMKNDLMSLLKMESINKEKAEDHPFLRYVEKVNKKYQFENE